MNNLLESTRDMSFDPKPNNTPHAAEIETSESDFFMEERFHQQKQSMLI